MIWYKKDLTLQDIIPLGKGTMSDYLDIEFTELGDDYIKARMPVDHRTKQPYGLLHGGASAVLAETLGSVGSALAVDHTKFYCVGVEINANHIRSVKEGYVTGHATPLYLGRQMHVWDIKIYNEENKLTCVSRLTVSVQPRS
ncbi:MAG TPA: hotdog fold thioesterase [Chitinophagaceae bacterium]|nr:hotdog fold thioesterase [Chitinophagaceae bacterium]